MRNIMNKISQFMYGRYGTDSLNIFLLVVWFILAIVGMFTRNYIISAIELLIIALTLFRMLSRNIPKRQDENRKFLYAFNKVKSFFKLQKRKIKDFKTHRYIKCPYCKSQLRVKKNRGKHKIRCPKCSKEFTKNILF